MNYDIIIVSFYLTRCIHDTKYFNTISTLTLSQSFRHIIPQAKHNLKKKKIIINNKHMSLWSFSYADASDTLSQSEWECSLHRRLETEGSPQSDHLTSCQTAPVHASPAQICQGKYLRYIGLPCINAAFTANKQEEESCKIPAAAFITKLNRFGLRQKGRMPPSSDNDLI